jgi:DNA-directed RNA polymerase specialized sigma24 family protein
MEFSGEFEAQMVEAVAQIRPDLRRLLFAHRIPPGEATELVERVLVGVAAHWQDIGDKGQWLLAAVQFECLTYWQERGLPSPAMRRLATPPARDLLVDRVHGRVFDVDLLRAMLPAARQRVVFASGGALNRLRVLLAVQQEPAEGLVG